ncbi:MAG: helix-turn-helix domain-containing protein [Microbacteriaceae bacterium]|nr:MAG: helix-turn-helix domain-containing protein [Microbacteriaceae bacterium]
MRPVPPSPSSAPIRIGPRLRETRMAQGMTISNLADATGLTKGFISRVERDETSPSVSTLVTLCQVLSLPIGALFEPPEHEVIEYAKAPLINLGGRGVVERMVTPRSESRVQIIRSRLDAGASGGDDYYTISCDVEAVHVLQGQITMRFPVGDVELNRGDTMTVPGREPHSWVNRSRLPAEVIWTIVPAAWSGSSHSRSHR